MTTRPSAVYGGLPGVNLGASCVLVREGVVQFLSADRLLRLQGRQSVHRDRHLVEPGLGRGQVGFHLGQRRLKGFRIDLVEPIALSDERALREEEAVQVTFDAGPYLDVLGSPRLFHHLQEDRHILLDGLDDDDLGGRGRGCLLPSAGGRRENRGEGRLAEPGTGSGV